VRLVDQAELADFALVDDAGAPAGQACATAGLLRTVKIVPVADASDVTITVSRDAQGEAQGADSRCSSIRRGSPTRTPPRCLP